jgi:hypothetical protein
MFREQHFHLTYLLPDRRRQQLFMILDGEPRAQQPHGGHVQ